MNTWTTISVSLVTLVILKRRLINAIQKKGVAIINACQERKGKNVCILEFLIDLSLSRS